MTTPGRPVVQRKIEHEIGWPHTETDEEEAPLPSQAVADRWGSERWGPSIPDTPICRATLFHFTLRNPPPPRKGVFILKLWSDSDQRQRRGGDKLGRLRAPDTLPNGASEVKHITALVEGARPPLDFA